MYDVWLTAVHGNNDVFTQMDAILLEATDNRTDMIPTGCSQTASAAAAAAAAADAAGSDE